MVLPMLAFAQSIEVKYSMYSKKRAEAINKIKGAKENQGYQGLLSGLSAEKGFILPGCQRQDVIV